MSATAETKTGVPAVKAAVKIFEAAQAKYRDYGAQDTEPDGVFQGMLWKLANDEDVVIPQSGAGWELYDSSMDCAEAAQALHLAALGVVQAIFACSMKESRELRKYLEDYCWRYS